MPGLYSNPLSTYQPGVRDFVYALCGFPITFQAALSGLLNVPRLHAGWLGQNRAPSCQMASVW